MYFDYFVSSVKTNEVNTVGGETFRFTHVGDDVAHSSVDAIEAPVLAKIKATTDAQQ